MTKGELLQILKDVPLSADVKVYDSRTNDYPSFNVNVDDYFDYESQTPIVTIEINQV